MKANLPKQVEDTVLNHVMHDLEPALSVVHTKLAAATIIGGLLSLLVCGQFGIGLTNFADVFTHKVHAAMGPLNCAIACGVLFSIFPVTVLRFTLCHPVQFKVITRKHKLSFMAWFFGFGGIMAMFGHHGTDLLNLVAWVASAIISAHVFSYLSSKILPQWNPLELLWSGAK